MSTVQHYLLPYYMAINNQARTRKQHAFALLSEDRNTDVNPSFISDDKELADASDEMEYDVELPPYSNNDAPTADDTLCWNDNSDGSLSSDSSDKSTSYATRTKWLDGTPLKVNPNNKYTRIIKPGAIQILEQASSPKIHSTPEGHRNHHPPDSSDLVSYLQQPFYSLGLKRIGWLGLFLMSLSATAWIMNKFERTLESQLELAYFVPFLVGHG